MESAILTGSYISVIFTFILKMDMNCGFQLRWRFQSENLYDTANVN